MTDEPVVERGGAIDEHLAVGLAGVFANLRVGGPGHDVVGSGVEVGEQIERLDRPLDALARPEQAPGEQARRLSRRALRPGDRVRSWCCCAVRDHRDLARVDVEAGDQTVVRGLGHHDHHVGGATHRLEHTPLADRRLADHGVGDDQDRHGETVHQGHDRFAVGPFVQTVFVLHDRQVGGVEHADGCVDTARRQLVERGQHHRIFDQLVVAVRRCRRSNDVDRRPVTDEAGGERGRERGDATRGRRERRQDAERPWGRRSVGERGDRGNGWHDWTPCAGRPRRRACGGRQSP